MKQSGLMDTLLKMSEWIMRIAWINILWIAHILLGAVIVGFLPATAAMFAVLRKWMNGKLEKSIYKEFWIFYKRDFWKANAAGVILAIAGYVLYIDLFVFQFEAGGYHQILQLLLYIIAFFYMLTAVFFFPVFVQYNFKWYQYMQYAIMTAFSFPLRALSMLAIGYGFLFLASEYSGTIFFFLGSVTAYLWLIVSLPLFEKLVLEKSSTVFHEKGV